MNTSPRHPTSPHLQIYRLPLTALISITHRATGVFLSLGALILVWALFALSQGPEAWAQVQPWLESWIGQLVLLGITYSLYFHFCHGIRHLFWDVGLGFELDTIAKTNWMVIVVSLGLTIGTWLVALGVDSP